MTTSNPPWTRTLLSLAAIVCVGMLAACGTVSTKTNDAQYVKDVRDLVAINAPGVLGNLTDAELVTQGKATCPALKQYSLKEAQDLTALQFEKESGVPMNAALRAFTDKSLESARVNLCGTTDATFTINKVTDFIFNGPALLILFLIGAAVVGVVKWVSGLVRSR